MVISTPPSPPLTCTERVFILYWPCLFQRKPEEEGDGTEDAKKAKQDSTSGSGDAATVKSTGDAATVKSTSGAGDAVSVKSTSETEDAVKVNGNKVTY